MKRLFCFFLAAILCLGAAAQQIRDIDITVEVNQDGSAWITQHWDVQVVKGTEWYIPINNLGPMTVSDLQVWEGDTAFQSLGDNWDVDRSREWKTGKCGIVRKHDGVELCWGQGEYGDHQWTAKFFVTGLVQALDDADAFNFMFVNPGLVAAPQHAKVTIRPAFECPEWTSENTKVWGFGFYGDINVVEGAVVAESSESFSRKSQLITLVRFDKGLFEPDVIRGGSFEKMKKKALKGSEYKDDSKKDGFWSFFWEHAAEFITLLFFALIGIPATIYILVATSRGYEWNPKVFGQKKIDGWYRDIPLEGNLMAAQFLLSKGKRFGLSSSPKTLIGAYFLRWIMEGHLTVMPDPKNAKRVNLAFKSETVSTDDVEESLYQMARVASGDNLLLESGEFEKWSTKNYSKLTAWPDRAIARGRTWFQEKGYIVSGLQFTPEGSAEACRLVQFKNFLKDFTLSDQREAVEAKLWKEYLVYAQLFDMAEKVAAQFKKLYPAEFQQLSEYVGVDSSVLWYALNWTNHVSAKAFDNAQAKSSAGSYSGGGGHTSFGGGGGFSGGGFGGGSR